MDDATRRELSTAADMVGLQMEFLEVLHDAQEAQQLRATLATERAEIERLKAICVAAHDRLLRGDDDVELLALLATAWANAPTERAP